jgi:thiamine pyrophosphate-dependent acetolactate synthase large subunit-like protein
MGKEMMSGAGMLDRREVVASLVRDRRDLIVISSLGSPTYDLAAAGDHVRNFYLWGAMGGAAQVGLGLALAQPDIPVAVIAGDGEALMGLGGFATIALQRPANLSVVILDNGRYGATSLAAVAAACGISDSRVIEHQTDVDALAKRLHVVGAGPTVAVVKIAGEDKPRCLPSRDGVWLKGRLRAELGFETM